MIYLIKLDNTWIHNGQQLSVVVESRNWYKVTNLPNELVDQTHVTVTFDNKAIVPLIGQLWVWFVRTGSSPPTLPPIVWKWLEHALSCGKKFSYSHHNVYTTGEWDVDIKHIIDDEMIKQRPAEMPSAQQMKYFDIPSVHKKEYFHIPSVHKKEYFHIPSVHKKKYITYVKLSERKAYDKMMVDRVNDNEQTITDLKNELAEKYAELNENEQMIANLKNELTEKNTITEADYYSNVDAMNVTVSPTTTDSAKLSTTQMSKLLNIIESQNVTIKLQNDTIKEQNVTLRSFSRQFEGTC